MQRAVPFLLAILLLAAMPAASQPYTFTTFAGSGGGLGAVDGPGGAARFNAPTGVAVDSMGNVFIADRDNHTIRKITPAGEVTTLAGLAGSSGSADGTGSAARFDSPSDVAVDGSGDVYVADRQNQTIRKVTPAGLVTTVAGLAGAWGGADGTGSAARFTYPSGVAVDGGGNVYVADTFAQTVRKITPAGVVTTLAGLAFEAGSADGSGSAARFYYPTGVAVDGSGNLYVADGINYTVRKITPEGEVSTLAGLAGTPGSMDGIGAAARFENPASITVDGSGNLYVADQYNHTIRKITPAGEVTTLAGLADVPGSMDGIGAAARFQWPTGVAVGGSGTIYVADQSNHTIRKVTPSGEVTTLAGLACPSGSTDATGHAARFNYPGSATVDGSGNLYVGDQLNHTIRKITPAGEVTTLAGLAGNPGSLDGTGSAARFYLPSGVAVDGSGTVFVSERYNYTVRKISPAGEVTTLAGLARVSGSADGTGSAARFLLPADVTVDGSGNVYVADQYNHTIRKISPAGEVTTLAGRAGASGSADGAGSAARFNMPSGVAVDGSGNVYVADEYNHSIRKISPAGEVTTLAGVAGSRGDADGTGSAARFTYPTGGAVDESGNFYVVQGDDTVRRITPAGEVTTLGGLPGVAGSSEGTGRFARFNTPRGIAAGAGGRIYVADSANQRIVEGSPGLPDVGTIDAATAPARESRQLGTTPATASSWSWTFVRRPSASSATLSDPASRTPTFIPDVPDLYVFRVTATDGALTSMTEVSLQATCPVTTLMPATLARAYPGVSFSETLSGNGGIGGPYSFALASGSLPEGIALSSAGVLSGTPATGGESTFSISVTGSYGCAGTETLTLVVNRAPAAAAGSVATDEDVAVAIPLAGGDPDGDALTYSVAAPSHGTLSGTAPALTYTPGADFHGSDSFTYTASDGFATSAAATVSITVAAVNDPPVLTAIGDRSVAENAMLVFALSATDVDGDSLTYSATGLPAGATLDAQTGAFSWSPDYDQSGSYPVTFTASDGIATDSETIAIAVTGVNRPPALTPIGDRTVDEWGALTFMVDASDPDGDTLTISVGGLPAGASFDPATQLFSWTPSYDDAGTHQLIFAVTDGMATVSEVVQIAVADATPAVAAVLCPAALFGGGGASEATVTLAGPAPAGGALVTLTSAVPGIATVPATVTVAAGETTTTFAVTPVAEGSALITASTPAGSASCTAVVAAAAAPIPTLGSIALFALIAILGITGVFFVNRM